MKKAKLSGADLQRAELLGTDLTGADLRQTNLQHRYEGKPIYDDMTVFSDKYDADQAGFVHDSHTEKENHQNGLESE